MLGTTGEPRRLLRGLEPHLPRAAHAQTLLIYACITCPILVLHSCCTAAHALLVGGLTFLSWCSHHAGFLTWRRHDPGKNVVARPESLVATRTKRSPGTARFLPRFLSYLQGKKSRVQQHCHQHKSRCASYKVFPLYTLYMVTAALPVSEQPCLCKRPFHLSKHRGRVESSVYMLNSTLQHVRERAGSKRSYSFTMSMVYTRNSELLLHMSCYELQGKPNAANHPVASVTQPFCISSI